MGRSNYRGHRGQLSRRRFITGVGAAGAGIAALPLVGCGDDDDDSNGNGSPTGPASPTSGNASPTSEASPSSSGVNRGGEFIFGMTPSNQPLDPHISLNRAVSYWPIFTNRLVDNDAVSIDPLAGALISEWEQVSDLELTLHAREGVHWHEGHRTDGRAFDAEDIQFNLERIIGKYDPGRVATFARRSSLSGLDRVEVIDATTARAIFTTPNPGFLYGVSDWRNSAVARETVEADPDFLDPSNFSGTGAFMVDSFNDATGVGAYITNPSYWKEDRPYMETVRQVDLPDSAAQLAAFMSGQIHMIDGGAPERRSTVENARADAEIIVYPGPLWNYWRLHQDRGQFTNVDVRRALFLALDYSAVMDQQYGEGFWDFTGTVITDFPGTPTAAEIGQRSPWNPATKEDDIAEARQLMDAAGFPEGEGISFAIAGAGTADTAIVIQGLMEEIWPSMDIEVISGLTGADFQRVLTNGDFDSIVYTSGSPPDAALDMQAHYHSTGSRNYTRFSNAEIDAVLDQLVVEFDTDARATLYSELETLLEANVWSLNTGRGRSVLIKQGEVQGFPGGGIGTFTGGLDIPFFVEDYWLSA